MGEASQTHDDATELLPPPEVVRQPGASVDTVPETSDEKTLPVDLSSIDGFIERMTEIGLMSSAEACAFSEDLPVSRRPRDGEELAHEMVREDKLTPYQVEALLGRSADPLALGDYVILNMLGEGSMARQRVNIHAPALAAFRSCCLAGLDGPSQTRR